MINFLCTKNVTAIPFLTELHYNYMWSNKITMVEIPVVLYALYYTILESQNAKPVLILKQVRINLQLFA
jgi:hypothetical protein